MINRTTKLRWRRRLRLSKKQVEDIGYQAEEHLERHFFKRLSRLSEVKRFVTAWLLLIILLGGVTAYQTRFLERYYLSLQPTSGGTYVEGIQGNFSNANPLFAVNNVDASVSRLVFASLLKYNQKNKLVGDLARSWKTDKHGRTYRVRLKPNLVWQDGKPLTARDVVFTYQTIQKPDAKSSLYSSWRNITVTAKDKQTIIFQLPSALSSFPHALTNGIVPRHLLSGIPLAQLRSVAFNTSAPVGAGPFKWKEIEILGDTLEKRHQRIALIANEKYHAGKPKLSAFVLDVFHDSKTMLKSFNKREINALVGLSSLPDDMGNNLSINVNNIPLSGEVMVFFKTSDGVLANKEIRRAVVLATNTAKVIKGLGYPVVRANQPFLRGQLGYNDKLAQPKHKASLAKKILSKNGWKVGPGGTRLKNKKRLSFKLYSQSNSEYAGILQNLQKQWRSVGIDVQVFLQPSADLQSTISFHGYDALVYGITVGADPDIFAYWHSSQADIRSTNRLNFSEYKSGVADQALEAGRNREDPAVRQFKYNQFLRAWRQDLPALALYQPRFLYVTRGQLFKFNPSVINIGADRFANVENWMINQQKLPK